MTVLVPAGAALQVPVSAFPAAATGGPATPRPAIGLGTTLNVGNALAAGTGLAVDGELVQLSAFAAEPAVAGRIRCPSRRR